MTTGVTPRAGRLGGLLVEAACCVDANARDVTLEVGAAVVVVVHRAEAGREASDGAEGQDDEEETVFHDGRSWVWEGMRRRPTIGGR